MKYVYVSALIDLRIKGLLKTPLEIRPNTFITNNPSHLRKFLKPNDILAIGSLEAELLLSGAPVIYRTDEAVEVEVAHAETVNLLREIQAFLTCLWLQRDNSANCELGFAISQTKKHVHSNSLVFNYTNASGERSNTEIDHTQLDEIVNIWRNHFIGIRKQDDLRFTAFQKGASRLNASMLFLQQARSSQDLGQKIANYCSYFEALLSTNSAELAHQLSERTAFLLRQTPDARMAHFRKTKTAYGIRSKVVHGDVVSKKLIPELVEIASHCDKTARELLKAIISSNELAALLNGSDSEAIDEFMLKLIFGFDASLKGE